MEKKYTIGLFFILAILCAFLCFNFWDRHRVMEEKIEQDKFLFSEDESLEESSPATQEVTDVIQTDKGYLVMIVDNYVCVLRAQDKSVYFQTDILSDELPSEVRKELEQGKYITSEIEVFHYLESYSS